MRVDSEEPEATLSNRELASALLVVNFSDLGEPDPRPAATHLNNTAWNPRDGPQHVLLEFYATGMNGQEAARQAHGNLVTMLPRTQLTQDDVLVVLRSLRAGRQGHWLEREWFTDLGMFPLDRQGNDRQAPGAITVDVVGIALETTRDEVEQLLQDMNLSPIPGTLILRSGLRRYHAPEFRGHGVGTARVTVTVRNTMYLWAALVGRLPVHVNENIHNALNNPRGGREIVVTLTDGQPQEFANQAPPQWVRARITADTQEDRMAFARILIALGIDEGEAGLIITNLLRRTGIPAIAVAFDDANNPAPDRAAPPRRTPRPRNLHGRPIAWWDHAGGMRVLLENRFRVDHVLAERRGEIRINLAALIVAPDMRDEQAVDAYRTTIDNIGRATELGLNLVPLRERPNAEAPMARMALTDGTGAVPPQDMRHTVHVTDLRPERVRNLIAATYGVEILRTVHTLQNAWRELWNSRYPDLPVERVIMRPNNVGGWEIREGFWIVMDNQDGDGERRAAELAERAQLDPRDAHRVEPVAVPKGQVLTVIRDFNVHVLGAGPVVQEWKKKPPSRPPRPQAAPAQGHAADSNTPPPPRSPGHQQSGSTSTSTAMIVSPSRPGRGRASPPPAGQATVNQAGTTSQWGLGASLGRGGGTARMQLSFSEQSNRRVARGDEERQHSSRGHTEDDQRAAGGHNSHRQEQQVTRRGTEPGSLSDTLQAMAQTMQKTNSDTQLLMQRLIEGQQQMLNLMMQNSAEGRTANAAEAGPSPSRTRKAARKEPTASHDAERMEESGEEDESPPGNLRNGEDADE